ncbi:MAG: hypothetical protein J5841_05425 [Clostridia bacterium]|nr:hypothetical protein [Clostridia bacterium]
MKKPMHKKPGNDEGENTMIFISTLNFNGKCREATEPHQRAFSGEGTPLLSMMRNGRIKTFGNGSFLFVILNR